MEEITKAIFIKISWDAFAFWTDPINDFALRVYIAQQLRALEQLEGVSDKKIEDMTDIIEATIIETPDEIKEIEDKEEQKQQFENYIRIKNSFKHIEDSELDIDLGGKGTMESSTQNIKNSTIKLR